MLTAEPFSKRFPYARGIKPKTDRPPGDRPKRDVLKLAEQQEIKRMRLAAKKNMLFLFIFTARQMKIRPEKIKWNDKQKVHLLLYFS
jgi:hypothetical protein